MLWALAVAQQHGGWIDAGRHTMSWPEVCPGMRRGMGPPQLRNVLQTLCLATRSSFDVIEDWVEATLLLPDLRLSQAVSALASMAGSLKPAPSSPPS